MGTVLYSPYTVYPFRAAPVDKSFGRDILELLFDENQLMTHNLS